MTLSSGKQLCDHRFVYAGIRFCHGHYNRPGSGAQQRYYAHVYFCERCTETKGQPIDGGQYPPNSYEPIAYGATPGSPDECGVPKHDRGGY